MNIMQCQHKKVESVDCLSLVIDKIIHKQAP